MIHHPKRSIGKYIKPSRLFGVDSLPQYEINGMKIKVSLTLRLIKQNHIVNFNIKIFYTLSSSTLKI